MVIEYARSMLGLVGASSAEFDPDAPDPVIATMADQQPPADALIGRLDSKAPRKVTLDAACLHKRRALRAARWCG